MGDQTIDLAALNAKVDANNAARMAAEERETRERKADMAERDKQFQLRTDIDSDNNDATTCALDYMDSVNEKYYERALTLQQSIMKFNDFLKLPEKSNSALLIWDAAWATLSAIVPALKLVKEGKYFKDLVEVARKESLIAEMFMRSAPVARIVANADKMHNVADVINKGNKARDGWSKTIGSGKATKLDTTMTPVEGLIKESGEAHKVGKAAIKTLNLEFKARIHSLAYKVNPPYAPKGTLLEMAEKLMPPVLRLMPKISEEDELEQFGRLYLWWMLDDWAKKHVVMETTQHMMTGSDSVELHGLNDNQQDQIMKWFDYRSNWKGGLTPVPASIEDAAAQLHVPRRITIIYGRG